MIGLDTNVLVRYLTRDDESQFRAAMKLLSRKGATFFVPDQILVELDWVLSRLYGWTCHEIVDSFARLLTVHNLEFVDEGRLRSALRAVRQGADLSDELIVAECQEHGCRELATFDTALAQRHPKFALIPRE